MIDGHVSGNGKTRHQEFAMASGEMTEAEFTDFLTSALKQLANWSSEGSVQFVAMDWATWVNCSVPGNEPMTTS